MLEWVFWLLIVLCLAASRFSTRKIDTIKAGLILIVIRFHITLYTEEFPTDERLKGEKTFKVIILVLSSVRTSHILMILQDNLGLIIGIINNLVAVVGVTK